jgi:hypothetical protein
MYRFFKCNVLGGFRLTDLNRKVHQEEFFYVDAHVCDTSRSVKAAINSKWMLEVSNEEASQHIVMPISVIPSGLRNVEKSNKRVATSVATPDVKEVNKKIESRQADRTFRKQPMQKQKEEDKPIVPDFNAVERKMKERQADVMTKGPDEIIKTPVKLKEEKVEEHKEEKIEKLEEVLEKPEPVDKNKEKNVEEVVEEHKEEKAEEPVDKNKEEKVLESVIKDLATEMLDNNSLVVPNFDEKKEDKTATKIRRRKKAETLT